MAQTKLTEAILKTLKPAGDEAQSYYWDTRTSGLGVVVGASTRTFVARAWVGGKRRRVKLGTWPTMSVEDARGAALTMLGTMSKGVDPNAQKRAEKSGGPTLREALKYHLSKMERGENRRGKVCSPRSIDTMRGCTSLHLADYLDGPLVALTADVIDEVRAKIEGAATHRGGANPDNVPGRAVANRILANVSAIWRSYHKRYGLPVPNPVERLTQAALKPRDTRVSNEELPAWYAKLYALGHDGKPVMSPIRRDLQLVSMFTGVRADGLRHLRWDDLDFDEELVQITRSKGDRPYMVPMTRTLREIFERRQDENAADAVLLPLGGDHGWVFPSISRDGKRVICVAEAKERHTVRDAAGRAQRDDDGARLVAAYLPGTHVNRRTYNMVAIEIGVPREARETLMNHEGRGVNMVHYAGRPEHWGYVRSQADLVEAALWVRIRGELPTKKKSKGKLRSVPAVARQA